LPVFLFAITHLPADRLGYRRGAGLSNVP
jgi:hypothetical protein